MIIEKEEEEEEKMIIENSSVSISSETAIEDDVSEIGKKITVRRVGKTTFTEIRRDLFSLIPGVVAMKFQPEICKYFI